MYTDIKTFEDACKKLGIEPVLPEVNMLPENMQKQVIVDYKLLIVAQAINDGWTPNWSNWDEYKYYPWFNMGDPSGVGFTYGDYVYDNTSSDVGSRLVFESREKAKYFGEQFIDLHKESKLIQK